MTIFGEQSDRFLLDGARTKRSPDGRSRRVNMSDDDTRSDDAKLAAQLEAAMDDPTEWGDAIPDTRSGRSEKRQRAAMISIRLTAQELETVQARAANRGLSVSQYVRELALQPTQASTYTLITSTNAKNIEASEFPVSVEVVKAS
jgi:predicted DNA binding CopG/RHH family protein